MSKYITHFQTEAEYQTALPTLDLPNVSLVDELGEVHYHRALYGAHAGDICLYDVAEGQKIVVTAENWNLTTYPTASYPIIGVVVMDETASGLTVMSNWFIGTDGSQSSTDTYYKWQSNIFDWGLTKYNKADLAKTDFNGKANTAAIINAIKAYDTSHSTDNITGNIGDIIQKYHTEGTIAGDWYIPACGEAYKLYENRTTLLASFDKINTASSSAGLSGSVLLTSGDIFSSSEHTYGNSVWLLNPSNGNAEINGKSGSGKVRAFTTFNS